VIAVGLFGTIFTKLIAASLRIYSDLELRIKSSNAVIAVGLFGTILIKILAANLRIYSDFRITN
jgi:hypothetical protein